MKNRLPPKNYRRMALPPKKIPPYFGFTASAKIVTAKNEKTANRLQITAVWQYRPARVRLKNITDDHPGILDADYFDFLLAQRMFNELADKLGSISYMCAPHRASMGSISCWFCIGAVGIFSKVSSTQS